MTTYENGTPAAPEWFHDPALERCIGCNRARVSCEAEVYFGSVCCGYCSHGLRPAEMKMPATWQDYGDQV
jgi:hypothetical protein